MDDAYRTGPAGSRVPRRVHAGPRYDRRRYHPDHVRDGRPRHLGVVADQRRSHHRQPHRRPILRRDRNRRPRPRPVPAAVGTDGRDRRQAVAVQPRRRPYVGDDREPAASHHARPELGDRLRPVTPGLYAPTVPRRRHGTPRRHAPEAAGGGPSDRRRSRPHLLPRRARRTPARPSDVPADPELGRSGPYGVGGVHPDPPRPAPLRPLALGPRRRHERRPVPPLRRQDLPRRRNAGPP